MKVKVRTILARLNVKVNSDGIRINGINYIFTAPHEIWKYCGTVVDVDIRTKKVYQGNKCLGTLKLFDDIIE